MTPPNLNTLERLARGATQGPWACAEGSTSHHESDDRAFWAAVLTPTGREIVKIYERARYPNDDRRDYDFDASYIAAANPEITLWLVAVARAAGVLIERGFDSNFHTEAEALRQALQGKTE